MKPLSSLQNWIYRLGGLMIILGAMLNPIASTLSPYIYCFGALMFAAMQMLQGYDGDSITIRRLRRQQLIGATLLLFSGVAMFGHIYHLRYLRNNEWLFLLLIAAILELYTAFRIPNELQKEERKTPPEQEN